MKENNLITQKKPYSILLVEDEKKIRDNYVRYLKKYFNDVYEAEDGEVAYSLYLKYRPEILILDIHIPSLDGLALLSRIRQTDHKTRCIMLTAYSDTESLLKATELNLTKYLLKPVSRTLLRDTLDLAIKELKTFLVTSTEIYLLKEEYSWDYQESRLFQNDNEVSLTMQERELLILFFNNISLNVSYETIIYHLWDDYTQEKVNAVKTLIKVLRKKLPPETILNIYGFGYRIA